MENNLILDKYRRRSQSFNISNRKSHVPSMEFISPVNKKNDKKLIIMLRGHIRDAFKDPRLNNLIKKLSRKYNITLYAHTWNIIQSDKSWRSMNKDGTNVTKEMITQYFDKIPKEIMIENEDLITLNGNIEGKISCTLCLVICWKNMWYGMNKIIQKIDVPDETTILNIRYDIFTIKNRLFTIDSISSLVDKHFNKYMYSNVFISEEPNIGIDNMIIGSVYSMRKLISRFHFDLDELLTLYPDETHQEYIVFKENFLLK